MVTSQIRYERSGKIRPCRLDKNDLLKLESIIQESFTTPEVERYFRVSTNVGNNRVFYRSVAELLGQEDLPPRIQELSFWIEGWDLETRLDKNILLDFSKLAIQLSVAGKDPVWVYDRYGKIIKFLKEKTAWYWPIVTLERLFIFITTLIIFLNVIIAFSISEKTFYLDEAVLIGLWVFLVFGDTRKHLPFLSIIPQEKRTLVNKENVIPALIIILLLSGFFIGTVLPFLRKIF